MPYIDLVQRIQLGAVRSLRPPATAGELNYVLTECVLEYLNSHNHTYAVMNDIVGALESCKLEFYRRVVAPHEDQAIERNGDVYP